MRIIFTCLLLFIFLQTANSSIQQPNINGSTNNIITQPGNIDLEVYSFIINKIFVNKVFIKNSDQTIVVVDETLASSVENFNVDESFNIFTRKLTKLSKETLINFDINNRSTYNINNLFKNKNNFALLKKADYDKLFPIETAGWPTFNQTYPAASGILKLSRIGFNPAKDQAFVYISFSCGIDCGNGRFFLLSKSSNGWALEGEFAIWRSK